MMNSIYSYVRNHKRQKVGIVVALVDKSIDESKVFIGYSKCNSKLEQFDKERGLEIAYERAITSSERDNFLPPISIIPDIEKMIERAKKYFKKDLVPTIAWGINEVKTLENLKRKEIQEKKLKFKENLNELKNNLK